MAREGSGRCEWWNHDDARAMRGALLELFESWKDLNRVCSETAFVDSDGAFTHTIKAADAARRRVLKILKKTEIQT